MAVPHYLTGLFKGCNLCMDTLHGYCGHIGVASACSYTCMMQEVMLLCRQICLQV